MPNTDWLNRLAVSVKARLEAWDTAAYLGRVWQVADIPPSPRSFIGIEKGISFSLSPRKIDMAYYDGNTMQQWIDLFVACHVSCPADDPVVVNNAETELRTLNDTVLPALQNYLDETNGSQCYGWLMSRPPDRIQKQFGKENNRAGVVYNVAQFETELYMSIQNYTNRAYQ